MRLYELLKGISKTDIPDMDITFITDNSKKVDVGSLFICIKGEKFDGHSVAAEMLEKGAAAVVVQTDLGLERQILVSDTREAYGGLCAAWFGHPEKEINLIGITGTNGKTTIANVVKHILTQNGYKVGLIGTIQNEIGDKVIQTSNTTPFTFELMELLRKMVDAGCKYAVLEVSSFGLVQKRIGPAQFKIALFTNLSQEHLDYHKNMEEYYKAKRMLFDICDIALCSIDDEYGQRLYNEITCEKYSYSITKKADYYADVVKIKPDETSFWFCKREKSHNVTMRMTGQFNVSNITGAIGVCLNLGLDVEDILKAVADYKGVRGRCEVIPTGRDFSVICDYAHTPDAIENILQNVRTYTEGRLISLFGCGGNRDKTKRPQMARAAAKYSDILIITSDNPRDENPKDIIEDILAGIEDIDIQYETVIDRREAIYRALSLARKGDIIVLAGKGHEDYQVLANDVHIHFDEREIVKEGLKHLGY
ncbi:MAG: UDP-N-acetylmuramoyl-L-alanyl-D-glutamate--2,6-diaminopimelate ligase [Clostridiales bacterium]|nr:UDP-N-acetylmuramoyl-L-alanyl-D-glutamate--2,6-diaminopimelate ligase [Clostridiales bacterium]